jgi:acyl carrier protein
MATPNVSDTEVLQRFAQIVAESLRIDAELVKPDAYLSDLGAESLDLLEITMEAEDAFNILIPQKNLLQTAQEVFGTGVLVQDGCLTEEGAKFLHRRMPELAERNIGAGASLVDVGRELQRVSAWVRMIQGLIEFSPRECPQCGTAFPKAVAGRLKCAQCSTQIDLPSGDDLNRRWVEEYHRVASSDTVPAAVLHDSAQAI